MKVTAQNVDQLVRDMLVTGELTHALSIISHYSQRDRDAAARGRIAISVEVDPAKFDNAVHQGMHVLQRLRDVKVPVTGDLHVTGVESGTLTIEAPDLVEGTTRYTWRPE